jgi:hypothetical protein
MRGYNKAPGSSGGLSQALKKAGAEGMSGVYFVSPISEIVIAEKVGLEARFSRLSDRADLEEILGDAPLSEVWYSGVLGGVPAGT